MRNIHACLRFARVAFALVYDDFAPHFYSGINHLRESRVFTFISGLPKTLQARRQTLFLFFHSPVPLPLQRPTKNSSVITAAHTTRYNASSANSLFTPSRHYNTERVDGERVSSDRRLLVRSLSLPIFFINISLNIIAAAPHLLLLSGGGRRCPRRRR